MLVYFIINMYLCTRKSAHCAGLIAIKALKKSDLVFEREDVVRFFMCVLLILKWQNDTHANVRINILLNNIIIKF